MGKPPLVWSWRVCARVSLSILTTGSENAGKTIADIVEDEGWESFRARETATLEAVTAPSTVIATGGGIILAPYNRQFMRERVS